jgi:hypothetical protein
MAPALIGAIITIRETLSERVAQGVEVTSPEGEAFRVKVAYEARGRYDRCIRSTGSSNVKAKEIRTETHPEEALGNSPIGAELRKDCAERFLSLERKNRK